MKPISLLTFATLTLFVHFSAQSQSVEVAAKWRKGEVRDYDCSIEERTYIDRDLTSESSFDYSAKIQVIEEKGDHYVLRYSTHLPSDYETDFYTIWDLADEIPIEVRTSAQGEIEYVTNAADCLARMKALWIGTLKNVPNAEKIDEMWNRLFVDFENSKDRDLALAGDLWTLLFWHGSELTVGEEYEFEAYIPGFDMLDDFPAEGNLRVSKITDDNILHGVVDYDLDEKEFFRVITDFVLDFAMAMVGQDAPEGALEEIMDEVEKEFRTMKLSRQVRFEMDLNAGWPIDVRDRVTVEFRGEKEVSVTKMSYNDGEIK